MLANKGIVPIGLITTNRAIVDLNRSSPKIFKRENKSINVTETISAIMPIVEISLLLKFL